jgi:Gamma-glutamyl cyclotransferase, AIG2-like
MMPRSANHEKTLKLQLGNGSMPEYTPIFFYGLFMDPKLLEAKGLHPVNVRQAVLDGFSLRVSKRAFLVPEASARVYGMVMSLLPEEISALYSDPSVVEYQPSIVKVHVLGESSEEAICYNLTMSHGDAQDARSDYLDQLRAIARRVGLPSEYIRQLN